MKAPAPQPSRSFSLHLWLIVVGTLIMVVLYVVANVGREDREIKDKVFSYKENIGSVVEETQIPSEYKPIIKDYLVHFTLWTIYNNHRRPKKAKLELGKIFQCRLLWFYESDPCLQLYFRKVLDHWAESSILFSRTAKEDVLETTKYLYDQFNKPLEGRSK